MTSPTITSNTNIFLYSNPIIFTTKMKINFTNSKKKSYICTFFFIKKPQSISTIKPL